MTMCTRAAVVRRRGAPFVLEDVDIDDPRPDEVIVRIVACGICHTDVAARDGDFAMQFPAVFGHEGAGVVEALGSGTGGVQVGDRVVLSFSSCGECSNCRAGHPAHCATFDELNFGSARMDGSTTIWTIDGKPVGSSFFGQSSFACHSVARKRSLVPVDAADDDELALFAPLGCGIQAGAGTVLNELKPRPGESLVVFGAGTVGLAAVMAGRLAGAAPIVAVDVVPSRLELAGELGATFTIDGGDADVGTRLSEIARGFDHGVDTTGLSRVIAVVLRSLSPVGRLSLLGVSADDEAGFSPTRGPRQEVFYSVAGDSDPQRFIPFLIRCYREGRFPFHKLIREYPASEIEKAVRDSLAGTTVKPLLRF